jgi:hypothetical protein
VTRNPIKPRTPPSVAEPDAHGQAALLLAESLLHMLVENGELTNAQAVEVVHTAALVKVEVAEAAGESKVRMFESLALLARMENTFQADEPDGSV